MTQGYPILGECLFAQVRRCLIRSLVVALVGLGLWQLATVALGAEPWDDSGYTGFYLMSLGLSALFGYFYPEKPWRWGLILTFAQLPIMLIHAEPSRLLLVGLLFLVALALPAVIMASAASHAARRHRRG